MSPLGQGVETLAERGLPAYTQESLRNTLTFGSTTEKIGLFLLAAYNLLCIRPDTRHR